MAWIMQIDEPKMQYFASEFEPQPFPLWDFGFQYQYKKCAKRINLITYFMTHMAGSSLSIGPI